MSRATINPDFFTEDAFLALSPQARYLAAYLICRESVVPVFKAKITMTKANFGVTDEDIVSLASVGITVVDGYWILDVPYIYYDMYFSVTNDYKYIAEFKDLPESVQKAVQSISNIKAKIKRDPKDFMGDNATVRSNKQSPSTTEIFDTPVELKESKLKGPETSPKYLEEISDEVVAKFAEKYNQSAEVVKREAFKCVNSHLSKNAKITDWNRAFHTWMTRGYDFKDSSSSSPGMTDLSHLGTARVERRNY